MTTFQAIIYGIVQGFSEILPISTRGHQLAVSYLIGWPTPEGPVLGTLSMGSLLAILVYFRHDWASIISSFIQVVIFRKKPMTLDERLSFFLIITTIPTGLAWYYFREPLAQVDWSPLILGAVLAVSGFLLWLTDYFSRKNKGMFDWNWLDCLVMGITQMSALIPGFGRMTGALMGGMMRHYNRETAAKYSLLAGAPVLLGSCILHFRGFNLHQPNPVNGMSWLSFWISAIVAMLTTLLVVGGFMRNFQRRGPFQYAAYRVVLAISLVAFFWFRNRG